MLLNRAARRRAERRLRKERPTRVAGFHGVVLQGGPLDGRIVGVDAPAMHPDWWRSWNAAAKHGWTGGPIEPGRYVIDPNIFPRTAVWQPYPEG
jgi:hypothetical protein